MIINFNRISLLLLIITIFTGNISLVSKPRLSRRNTPIPYKKYDKTDKNKNKSHWIDKEEFSDTKNDSENSEESSTEEDSESFSVTN